MAERGKRKIKIGKVVSDKMTKTIVVAVDTRSQHGRYKKTLTRTKKYKAHDEKAEATLGDVVEIAETRPLSSQKRWRLVKVVEKAK